jgi:preprotein translocase subunit SecG
MENYLGVAQILISILLVISILLQVRGQGGGLFGSAQGTFRVRRGVDKLLFQATIVLVIIFLLISILTVRFFSGT